MSFSLAKMFAKWLRVFATVADILSPVCVCFLSVCINYIGSGVKSQAFFFTKMWIFFELFLVKILSRNHRLW